MLSVTNNNIISLVASLSFIEYLLQIAIFFIFIYY